MSGDSFDCHNCCSCFLDVEGKAKAAHIMHRIDPKPTNQGLDFLAFDKRLLQWPSLLSDAACFPPAQLNLNPDLTWSLM